MVYVRVLFESLKSFINKSIIMTSKTKAKTVAKNVKKSSIQIPDSTVRIMRNYMKFNDLLEAKYGTRILLNSFISL